MVDIGGTNMRAAVVELSSTGSRIVLGPIEERLRLRDGNRGVDATEFFMMQARLAAQLGAARGLPVGYCFSYPSQTRPDRDAVLLRWTKNIEVPGVVGLEVGRALRSALEEVGLSPGPVRVLNDTVAALLAAAALEDSAWSRRDSIGLIVGTGTNTAAFFDSLEAPKLATYGTDTMAINLESGNIDPPYLTEADDAVDAASPNPGHQRFEKAVSGYYLPFVFKACRPEHELDPKDGAGPLGKLAASNTKSPAQETARAILDRSADLVAASLCAVIDTYRHDTGPVGILAEGSLFWRAPGYAQRVEKTLSELAGAERPFSIVRREDANLYGAATAALTP